MQKKMPGSYQKKKIKKKKKRRGKHSILYEESHPHLKIFFLNFLIEFENPNALWSRFVRN